MLAAVTQVDFNTILAVTIAIGTVGFAVGQWRNGKFKALSESLTVALQEVELMKGRSERLEREVTELRHENETLRSLVLSSAVITDAMRPLLRELRDDIVKSLEG